MIKCLMPYKAIIFDLDDTLLDSSEQLIPQTLRKVFGILQKHQLPITWEEFHLKRKDFFEKNGRGSFFQSLLSDFDSIHQQLREKVKEEIYSLYYFPEIPPTLRPIGGAVDLLNDLHGKIDLYLVTSGNFAAQNEKVDQLKIRKYFKQIFCVEKENSQSKQAIFLQIIKNRNCLAKDVLCVGNRIDNELLAGKKVGCDTCLFRHGEYQHLIPIFDEEKPDFVIQSINEVKSICQI